MARKRRKAGGSARGRVEFPPALEQKPQRGKSRHLFVLFEHVWRSHSRFIPVNGAPAAISCTRIAGNRRWHVDPKFDSGGRRPDRPLYSRKIGFARPPRASADFRAPGSDRGRGPREWPGRHSRGRPKDSVIFSGASGQLLPPSQGGGIKWNWAASRGNGRLR